jgi:hypothetical protein
MFSTIPGRATAPSFITPQKLQDIAAVQHLYGVNSATRSGNDTRFRDVSLQIKTIWDGGEPDTT